MPDDALLTVRRLSKSFGNLRAVNDLSFHVLAGEVFGIAGPNGAGKSTVVNLLSRVPYGPDAGAVEFAGRSLDSASARKICRAGLTRTFQAEAAFDSLSAYDNVRVSAAYGARSRLRGRRLDARVFESLEFVGLMHRAHEVAGSLPVLARKQLMIASAWATRPRLIMMDEPAGGLSEPEQHELARLIYAIRDAGVAVVVIEHVLPLMRAVADRMLVMVNGASFAEGEPNEVLRDPRVVETYVGARG